MSKVIELMRPEQAIKGFDVKNLSKSGLDALNEVTVENGFYTYKNMVKTEPSFYIEPRGFGNFMSSSQKFIIPEIFPLRSEKNFAGFQKFALPMVRNFRSEQEPYYQLPSYQSFKYPYRLQAARNYVAYDFQPFCFPCSSGITDSLPDGVLIAIDAGAAVKARFHLLQRRNIKYGDNSTDPPQLSLLLDEVVFEGTRIPLFEADIIPFERNYIYLFTDTVDYARGSFPSVATPNIEAIAGNPVIRLELFSEDYSSQPFSSQMTMHIPTSGTAPNIQTTKLVNVSTEKAVVARMNTANAQAISRVLLYNENTFPNELFYVEETSIITIVYDSFVIKALNTNFRFTVNGTPHNLYLRNV